MKTNKCTRLVTVLTLIMGLSNFAYAARYKGKSGNTNCVGSCGGAINVQYGWTKCRAVSGNGTYWVNPSTGICEHWNTPYCNLTSGKKLGNAPRSACPK